MRNTDFSHLPRNPEVSGSRTGFFSSKAQPPRCFLRLCCVIQHVLAFALRLALSRTPSWLLWLPYHVLPPTCNHTGKHVPSSAVKPAHEPLADFPSISLTRISYVVLTSHGQASRITVFWYLAYTSKYSHLEIRVLPARKKGSGGGGLVAVAPVSICRGLYLAVHRTHPPPAPGHCIALQSQNLARVSFSCAFLLPLPSPAIPSPPLGALGASQPGRASGLGHPAAWSLCTPRSLPLSQSYTGLPFL